MNVAYGPNTGRWIVWDESGKSESFPDTPEGFREAFRFVPSSIEEDWTDPKLRGGLGGMMTVALRNICKSNIK